VDSPIELLKRLISEGEGFTFETFCYPKHIRGTGLFCGEDKPDWLAWKARSYNIVEQLTEKNSPNLQLVAKAKAIRTEGNYPDEFERARSAFLKALRLTLEAVEQDAFGEIRSAKSTSNSPSLSNKVFVAQLLEALLRQARNKTPLTVCDSHG
jgi:hypothetical protein